MTVFVVDASVGVKWLLPEPGTLAAWRLRDPIDQLHVPASFDVEIVANTAKIHESESANTAQRESNTFPTAHLVVCAETGR